MKIQGINSALNFKNQTNTHSKEKPKREIIDVIVDNVKNPRDVNDCVAVPRGIFKAYISLMAGTGLMAMSNWLPQKTKAPVNIIGGALAMLSAYYFAKPFAFKGVSPTVTKEQVEQENLNQKTQKEKS